MTTPFTPLTPISALAIAIALVLMTANARAQSPAAAPAASAAPAATPPAAPAKAAAAAPATGASEGKLAWYGRKFSGRRTASGQAYNPEAMTMAHKDLPFGSRVKVTNMKNNRSVVLRVNDRGPTQADRVGDVSQAAARKLGMFRAGVIDARLEVVAASTGSAKAPKKRA